MSIKQHTPKLARVSCRFGNVVNSLEDLKSHSLLTLLWILFYWFCPSFSFINIHKTPQFSDVNPIQAFQLLVLAYFLLKVRVSSGAMVWGVPSFGIITPLTQFVIIMPRNGQRYHVHQTMVQGRQTHMLAWHGFVAALRFVVQTHNINFICESSNCCQRSIATDSGTVYIFSISSCIKVLENNLFSLQVKNPKSPQYPLSN